MIKNLINYAKKEKIDLEVYSVTNKEITIEYLNDELSNYKIQNIKEYKIKSLLDGAAVKLKTLDISNPKEIIELLKATRELTDELDDDALATSIDIEVNTRKSIEVKPQEIKANINSFNKYIKEKYPSVFTIHTEYNFELDEYDINNTNGVSLHDSNYHAFYYSDIVLKINDKNLSCEKYVMAKEIDFEKFKTLVEEKIKDTLNRLSPKSISTNKYNIILENKCVFDILNAISPAFYAKNIINKQSPLTNKFNQKIFSDKITIVEDPTNPELIGTRLFDSEGTKTCYKKIIEQGIFKTKLYNKKYAAKDNTNSTGNVFGVRNMSIIQGTKNKFELLKRLNNGIIINKLMGIHSSINQLTGDISIQCEGYIVRDGNQNEAINQIVLVSNIFELFTQVKEIGADLEWFGTTGGAPSLLIENITIAGKEGVVNE